MRERVRAGVTKLREWVQPWAWITLVVLNADNYRKPAWQVGVELRAIAAFLRPDFIDVIEALGNDLPEIRGYVLIRDLSTLSRANIAAYVRDDLPLSHVRWHDMEHGWPRIEGPARDARGNLRIHEPRSFLTYRIARLRRGVAHDPDPRAKGGARREHRRKLTRWLVAHPLWPLLLGEDSNGNAPVLLRAVRKVARLRRLGRRVDTALGRGLIHGQATYLTEVPRTDARGSVRFMGDHKGFLVVRAKVATRFLRPRQPRHTDPRLSEVLS